MPGSPDINQAPEVTFPADLVEVGSYTNLPDAFDHGLVVLAAGHAYWLEQTGAGHRLLVEPAVSNHVRRQLALFDRESADWPPPPLELAHSSAHVRSATPFVWAALVIASYFWESAHPRWIEAGSLDADAMIRRGEWWRAITALFLHADPPHVISNVLSGLFVFWALIATLGRLRGWLALLGTAIAGNVAAVLLQANAAYRSVGASTAVFAGVGLLTGHAVRRMLGTKCPGRGRALFTPLASGLTVLALYGSGGVHVDVIAHATGFVAGVLAGAALPPRH